MDLVCVPPVRAGSLVWQPRAGSLCRTLVCKLTFALTPGESPLAEDQEEINEHDHHWNDDERRSLYVASDLVPRKARADVTLVGNAFAPGGEPVRSMVVRLVAGSVDKQIEIVGERSMSRDGAVREPMRFAKMPLRYERAAGGPGTPNPVGVRVGRPADASGTVALPNLQAPGAGSRPEAIEPVGFGPMPASFPARRDRLGRHSGVVPRLGEEALPEDFDFAYFNAAPADQQPDKLHEAERIVLHNLHREHPRLTTSLPGSRPRAFVEREGAAAQEVALRCDTLWIDTDRAICTLTWRGEVALTEREERGRIVVGLEGRGARVTYEGLLEGIERPRESRPRPRPPSSSATSAKPPAVAPPAVATPPPPAIATPPPSAVATPPPSAVAMPPPPAIATPPLPSAGVTAPPALVSPPSALAMLSPSAVVAPPVVTPPPSAVAAPPPAQAPYEPPQRVATMIDPPVASAPNKAPAWLSSTASGAAPASVRSALASAPAVEPAPRTPRPRASPRVGPLESVEVLWLDRSSAARLRAALFDSANPVGPSGDTADDHFENDVAQALSTAQRVTPAALDEAVAAAASAGGRFRAPALALAGELRLLFDELETLRLTVSAALPFAVGNPGLREVIDSAKELLGTPWLAPPAGVVDGLAQRVRDAFSQGGRSPSYLSGVVERSLLERRAYQRRTVLGAPHLRALLLLPGGETARPTYLPAEIAAALPMFTSFEARLIAEIHPAQEQAETSATALRALAVGRAVPIRR